MIALPEAGPAPRSWSGWPPGLRTTLWPGAGKTEDLARLVVDRLGEVSVSLGQRHRLGGEEEALHWRSPSR
jgi:hypothetical protein